MKLSLIIPTLNRANQLDACLLKIFKAKLQNDISKLEIEVIVVDQSLDEKTYKLCKKYKLKYKKLKKIGLSRARNVGIRESIGDYLIFLDDDIHINEDYFIQIQEKLIEKSNIDCLTGRIINLENQKVYSRHQIVDSREINYENFDIVLSSGTVVKKSFFDSIGFFDEKFGLGAFYGGSEEADLIIRGINKNKKIYYDSNLIIYHPKEEASLLDFSKRWARGFSYGKGRGALISKHLGVLNYQNIIKNFIYPILGFGFNIMHLRMGLSYENLGSFFGRIYGFIHYSFNSQLK